MKKLFVLVAICLAFIGCATLKNIGKTTNDVARALCDIFAVENTDKLQGMSPQEWCDLHENLEPFVEYILSAKQAAGAEALGYSKEQE